MGKLRKNNLADINNDSSKSPPVVGKISRSPRKNLLHFPNEILLKIFQNYKIGQELNIRKVCSRLRDTYDHALVRKFDLFISKIKQESNITKELHLSCLVSKLKYAGPYILIVIILHAGNSHFYLGLSF